MSVIVIHVLLLHSYDFNFPLKTQLLKFQEAHLK